MNSIILLVSSSCILAFLAITSDFTDAALFMAQVTAATCSFMVFFSATMSAIQYLLLGMEHIYVALGFAFLCFVASLIGLKVVHSAVEKHGRASLIVFSVSTVMALSAVLMTSFGALHVWTDYTSGRYMGFKTPCWKTKTKTESKSIFGFKACKTLCQRFLANPRHMRELMGRRLMKSF